MDLYLHRHIKSFFSNATAFNQLMKLQGKCFRQQKNRLTQRIQLGDQTYFIKQHFGVGWKEIFKNILQGRLPILGAKNEWEAIQQCQSLHIAVPKIFAYGERGWHPAYRQSFILLEDLASTISLEDLIKQWPTNPPSFQLKRWLIEEIALIARKLHQHGLNHRDFYLCHFLLSIPDGLENVRQPIQLYLIDLHRAQWRTKTPLRWIIKDLAALYFSSKEIILTQRDLYRFMKVYHNVSLREIICSHRVFWEKVKKRGENYRDHTV